MLVSARFALRGLCVPLAAAYALVVMAHADALRAAGINGQAPANATAIKTFVSTLTDNALWLIGTIAALTFLVIGGMFFFGHSRAADFAAKIAIGAVLLVSAPGIAA